MKTISFAVLAVLLVSPARAADEKAAAPAAAAPAPAKPSFSFGGFLKNLRESLEKSAVAGERKKGRGASVAAVRGAGQANELANPDEPTLKGDYRSRKMAKQAAEDAELLKAAQLAEKDPAAGLAAFQDFQKKYPRSHQEDVEKAIAGLQAAAASAAAPAAEPAAMPGAPAAAPAQ